MESLVERARTTSAFDGSRGSAGSPLSERELTSRIWSFGPTGHGAYSAYVRLLPNGRIGGHDVETERRWALEDGQLIFFDSRDRRSTIFNQVSVLDRGRLLLVGDFQFSDSGKGAHELREVEPASALAEPADDLQLMASPTAGRRRNLVVVRADERSLHRQWLRDIKDEDRNWDLCISFFGSEAGLAQETWAEYRVLQNGMRKCQALYHLFHSGSPLFNYERVAFFDDDIMTTHQDMNELFAICRDYDLQLAQPGLSADSYVNYPMLKSRPEYILRFVSFVEFMCAVFRTDALQACAPTFQHNAHGFGIDNVWPKLIGEPRDGIAVVDKVTVAHTRPLASSQWYDLATAVAEGNEVQRRYDAPSRVQEYGGVTAQPITPAP